jgi:hypothetical protein
VVFNPWALELHSSRNMQEPRLTLEDLIFSYKILQKRQTQDENNPNKFNFFIITNLIHKFLVHSHKLHKIKFLYMFQAQSAHHKEVDDVNCTYAASGIVTLRKCHLQRMTIPEAAYVQFTSSTS